MTISYEYDPRLGEEEWETTGDLVAFYGNNNQE